MSRRLFAMWAVVSMASLPSLARQSRPADALDPGGVRASRPQARPADADANNPILNEELTGQAGETPPISLSRLLAGVRHYPAGVIRSLLVLGKNPLVLRQLADDPELVGNPDNIVPPVSDDLKSVIRELAATPALIAVAAAHPAEMTLLRQVYAEAPDGVEQRIVELRASFTRERLRAAAEWQKALENDPAALGEYRSLLTAFTRHQQKEYDNFPFVHVTKRAYYYAAPPNEGILEFAQQRRGELKSLWPIMTRYWTTQRPEELDSRALVRDKQPAPPLGDGIIAGAPAAARTDMWSGADRNVADSIGFMPVIMQPLGDQPPEARYAFAIADQARLWTTQAPQAFAQDQENAEAAGDTPVDQPPADVRVAAPQQGYAEDAGSYEDDRYVAEEDHRSRRYYGDPYDYYDASYSYRYYYSSVFPYYYGYPYYSPIYAGAFPYYGGYYHLYGGHYGGFHDAVIGRIGRGRLHLGLSFGDDHHGDDHHGGGRRVGFGTRFAERTLFPRALHEPRDHASRAIRNPQNHSKVVRRDRGDGSRASSLLSPRVIGGAGSIRRSGASDSRTIRRRTANSMSRNSTDRRSDGRGSDRSTRSGTASRFGSTRGSSGVSRSGSTVAPRRSITRSPSTARSSRGILQRSGMGRTPSRGTIGTRPRSNISRSFGSGLRRGSSRTPTRTIRRSSPSSSMRRTVPSPSRRSSFGRSNSPSRSRGATIGRSSVSRSRSSFGRSRSSRSVGRRSTGRSSPRRRP